MQDVVEGCRPVDREVFLQNDIKYEEGWEPSKIRTWLEKVKYRLTGKWKWDEFSFILEVVEPKVRSMQNAKWNRTDSK